MAAPADVNGAQANTAKHPPRPLDMWEVLAEEFKACGHKLPDTFAVNLDADPLPLEAKAAKEKALFKLFHDTPRSALCLSGGGVRSATICLGVLQGLAHAGKSFLRDGKGSSPLTQFDYISTVSGGGYIGSWFSAWAQRAQQSAEAVVEAIVAPGASNLDPEPPPVLHLRKYCRFLNPKMGSLSADTWTLVATVVRNMVLNWLILIPLFMAALVVPLLYKLTLASGVLSPSELWRMVTLVLGAGFGAWAAAYVGYHIPSLNRATKADGKPPRGTDGSFVLLALTPFTLSAIFLTLNWAWYIQATQTNYLWWQFASFGAGVYAIGSALAAAGLKRKHRASLGLGGVAVGISLFAGAAAGLGGYFASNLFMDTKWEEPLLYSCLAVPLVLLMFNVAAILGVGLTSEFSGDDDREWWARSGGWVLIVMAVWLVFSAAVLFGPSLMESGIERIIAGVATAGFGGLASWLGKSAKTLSGMRDQPDASGKKKSPIVNLAMKAVAPLFLLMLIAVLAEANDSILEMMGAISWMPNPWFCAAILMVALLTLAVLSSWVININRFSLHAMYRARLVRTYLGASRPDRSTTANPFTDLDENDNLPLAALPTRPLHIVNMALNLVGSKHLAWQQRKAESFTASPLHTGSARIGYQKTDSYAGAGPSKSGFTLGSAMAISGAAASPNMGYHSSPMLSLVMTLFNARLGWWLANPGPHGKGKWAKDGPTMSFLAILNEAFGRTSDQSRWIYLSDGGHFENLGLYEMVLRRCHTIVIVDGSQDGSYTFEDLGNAVRKVRVDLGIPIQFKKMPIYRERDERNRYCAVGTIQYKCVDEGAPDGQILYIKACLNGSEPADVLNYASVDSKFPQQGTEELWFDETQFESYRRLGAFMVEQIVEKAKVDSDKPVLEELLSAAQLFIDPEAELEPPPRTMAATASEGGATKAAVGGPPDLQQKPPTA